VPDRYSTYLPLGDVQVMEALTLSLTVIPSILIALFVVFSDRFREPTRPIVYAFLLGFIVIIPAGFLNTFLISDNDTLAFIAGFTEEPLKFLTMYIFLRLRDEFNEPMDAIVYATLISLGFATLENFEYVYGSDDGTKSIIIAFIRALCAIPLHACCGVVMGYYYGRYVFEGSTNLFIKSICFPIMIHSSYNYMWDFNAWIQWIFVPIIILYATYLLDKMGELQKLKEKEEEIKF